MTGAFLEIFLFKAWHGQIDRSPGYLMYEDQQASKVSVDLLLLRQATVKPPAT
jgi:hypothetical protein